MITGGDRKMLNATLLQIGGSAEETDLVIGHDDLNRVAELVQVVDDCAMRSADVRCRLGHLGGDADVAGSIADILENNQLAAKREGHGVYVAV